MIRRLPTAVRIALLLGLGLLSAALCYGGYRCATRPTTLTIAVGSIDGEMPRLMASLGARMAAMRAPVRLKVIEKDSAAEAAQAFARGDVNLAVIRADGTDLSAARAIVLLTHGVVLILVPPGSTIESMGDLKGKIVGVVGGDANRRVVEVLDKEFDLTRAKTQFRNLEPNQVRQAVQSKQIHALLVVAPIADRYLTLVKNLFPQSGKRHLKLIAIEASEAIERVAKAYEKYELPKGSVRGAPPIPDEDLTTLRVPLYLAGNKNLSEDTVGELAKALMDARRDLIGDYPLLAQISGPDTDKDAFIPAHPGAKAYFDGEQKTFFDRYGDQIFYGSMALGSLTSLLAAVWKLMGLGGGGTIAHPLAGLHGLAAKVRSAGSESELEAVEEEVDAVLDHQLARCEGRDDQGIEMAALCLSALRLEQLVHSRRLFMHLGTALAAGAKEPPAPEGGSAIQVPEDPRPA